MDLLAGSAERISVVSVVSCLLAASLWALDWVIIFSSSAVLISGYVLRVLLTSVGQSRDGGQ
jgi:hypothetical protein